MMLLIFANGVIEDVDWIRPYLAQGTAVWAANGGTRHLFRLSHLPDRVIGDLDSLPQSIKNWLAEGDVPITQHPPEKDETDLELALLKAAKHTAAEIWLFGLLGGRLDQMLANIFLLGHPALVGKKVRLITPNEQAWLVRGQTEIEGQVGDLVSLIPLTGDVRVAQTNGLAWPLQDEALLFGQARGISNYLTEQKATVALAQGMMLCVHTRP